tara:strand:+ start:299 stop:2893 length:2595 start_codon:yes stop_codon:yes gene_type:complete
MSDLRVSNLRGRSAGSAPNLPDGVVVNDTTQSTSVTTGAVVISGGVGIAKSLHVGGNVSVGGTLTYEDVTNVDSVGLITAKSGIKVGNPSSPGIGVTIDPNGNAVFAGILTATTFSGIEADKIFEGNTEVETIDTGSDGYVKMTTEGSERVRVGPAGQIGLSGPNYGTAGQLLTSSGNASAATWTTVDAAPQVKLNASGTIAAGKPTIVNTDGTVSEVKETLAGLENPTYTGQNNIANPADYPVGVHIPGTDKMLMAYQYASGANAGYARVMTRAAKTLTQIGNEPSFEGGQVRNIGVVWDDNASRGVIFYVDSDDSSKFKARVCQVSGTTLSYGSITDFPGGETGETGYLNHRAVYDPDTQKIIIGFSDGSNGSSWVGKAYVCTIDPSTNAISFGAVSTIYNSYNVRKIDLAYDTTNNKVVAMIAADTGNSDAWIVSKVGTVSGTGISSWGTEDDISTTQSNNASMVWMSDQQKLFCAYESDQSNKLFARIGTPSSTNVTWGTAVQCSSNNTTLIRASAVINAAYDTYAKLPVVTWRATYSGDSIGFVAVRSISGTTPTFTNAVELSGGGGTRGPFACSMNTSEGIPVMWRNTSGPCKYVFVSFAEALTNVTSENFLGISAASYTNGQEATIQITGSSNSNQVGLTTGQNYYVQKNGTLSLTAASPKVYAGTAVSQTKLVVGKESPQTNAWEVVATHDLSDGIQTINNTGWSDAYQVYKLVITGLSGLSSLVYLRYYFDASASNAVTGTLATQDKYNHRRIGAWGTNPNVVSGENTYHRLYGNSAARFSNIELTFPMHRGGSESVSKGCYGTVWTYGYEVYQEVCTYTNSTQNSEYIKGVQVYFPNGVSGMVGRLTFLRQKYS